jgi:uncharacterized protein YecE (DUF72 family)
MHIGNVWVGTCGFSYEEWKGAFYPADLPSHEMLRYYSLVFSFVELDNTWYRIPNPGQLERMALLTPSDFRISLKVHRSLTHEIDEHWQARAAEFRTAVSALASSGRLGCVLVQLPYRFSYTLENRKYLANLLAALSDFPLVVEFRNATWYQERVFDTLRERKIGLVTVDRPDLPGLPPESVIITSDICYYRLHGRNADLWWSGDAASRYEYYYSEQELRDRARLVRAMSRQAKTIFVAFNNHASGNAPKNAALLQSIVAEQQA